MARRKSSNTDPLDPTSEMTETHNTPETSGVSEVIEESTETPLPAETTLVVEPSEGKLKERQSKGSIEAAIHEKLSRRSDEGSVDPFVPSPQLQKEVKQVAEESGFHLTRGTEAGAALMARARRRPTP